MYVTVDVYDYVETDVEINTSFINGLQERLEYFVEKNFEKEEDRNKYKEHVDAIVELLEKEKDNNYSLSDVSVYIDQVDVDENDIPEKDNYDDGYEDAKNELEQYRDRLKSLKSPLFLKIERKAYNYGKQEEITREDCKELSELFESGHF